MLLSRLQINYRYIFYVTLIIVNKILTSIAPISSKRIELSGTPSTGVKQSHSQDTTQSSSTNDQMPWKLRSDKQVWKGEFSNGVQGVSSEE